jgi:hypothetical protein
MKRTLAVLALAFPACGFAAAPNAQDYSIQVHVSKSWIIEECGSRGCSPAVRLEVVIEGKKYQIEDEKPRSAVLKPGDYPAKVLKNPRAINISHASYDDIKVFEFLFPDGQTRKYNLVGEEE